MVDVLVPLLFCGRQNGGKSTFQHHLSVSVEEDGVPEKDTRAWATPKDQNSFFNTGEVELEEIKTNKH